MIGQTMGWSSVVAMAIEAALRPQCTRHDMVSVQGCDKALPMTGWRSTVSVQRLYFRRGIRLAECAATSEPVDISRRGIFQTLSNVRATLRKEEGNMAISTIPGFPRIGDNRQLKWALEGY